jgi:hypothetical protein
LAKNIVIAECGTAKTFTAQKIQTRQTGSGTVNWVPEDEVLDYVDLKDKEFTANGTYEPSDFSCDGFDTITVNVPANVKEKNIVQNGTYYAADDNCMGYSKVNVNVSGGGGGIYFPRMFISGAYLSALNNDYVKWIGKEGSSEGANYIFAPLDDSNAGIHPFKDGDPFKIHMRIYISAFNTPDTLFGVNSGDYFFMPSIDIYQNGCWFGYSTNGFSWNNDLSITSNIIDVGNVVCIEFGWDGAKIFIDIYDDAYNLVAHAEKEITQTYYICGSNFWCVFGGIINAYSNKSDYIWFDLGDTYIEVDGDIIWGNSVF